MVPSSLLVLASSVCKSLQYLIFALTQVGKGGHLFRLACSVVLGGGGGGGGRRNITNISLACVGVLTVYGAH